MSLGQPYALGLLLLVAALALLDGLRQGVVAGRWPGIMRLWAGRERVDLEDAHRTVPHHRLRARDDRPVGLDRLRPDVEPHAIADRGVADVDRLGRLRMDAAVRHIMDIHIRCA
jgi:hypothetical protein